MVVRNLRAKFLNGSLAAEQPSALAGQAQDLSSLQPPDLLRTIAADEGLETTPDPSAVMGSQRARMAEEFVQRVLAESSPDDPVFTGGELDGLGC